MCVFCDIVDGRVDAHVVYDDEHSVGFLDQRPLFPGHSLLVPRAHIVTVADLPGDLIEPFFNAVKKLSVAVQQAMASQGSFVAINNIVSQSVPHLHAHVVPRNRKDGLRGFFWPRHSYDDADHMSKVADAIRARLT